MVDQDETRDETQANLEGDTQFASTATGDDDSDAPVAIAPDASRRAVQAVGPGEVRADVVNLSQGGANTIDARTVSITNGGAAVVRAEDVSISNGGVALARTGRLTVKQGGSSLLAVADKADVEAGGSVLVLVANSTSGDVRPMLDWRAALALGAGVGIAISLLRRVLR